MWIGLSFFIGVAVGNLLHKELGLPILALAGAKELCRKCLHVLFLQLVPKQHKQAEQCSRIMILGFALNCLSLSVLKRPAKRQSEGLWKPLWEPCKRDLLMEAGANC